jgi:tetratricopeptide (TPR) repeat protein
MTCTSHQCRTRRLHNPQRAANLGRESCLESWGYIYLRCDHESLPGEESPLSSAPESVGTLDVALAHTARLLESQQPALAVEQAGEILKAVPGHPVATLLLGVGRHAAGEVTAALEVLEALCRTQPNWAAAHLELGLAYATAGRGEAAVAPLRRAVQLKPDLTDAWRVLADHLTVIGDTAGADAAYAQHIRSSTKDPRLLEAAAALCQNEIPKAEALLRSHLTAFPTDVAAIRMLAEVAGRLRRYQDAEHLLSRCLELAPSFAAARHNYAFVLHRQNKATEALVEIDQLLAMEPRQPSYRNLKAAILCSVGEYETSIKLYEEVLAEYATQARVWMSYGHVLKTAGRENDGIAAYKKSIELAPNLGEAYWSLANLKTFRFMAEDIAAMRAQLARADLAHEDRFHFHFALGKALEDNREYAESFEHYAEGNRLRRRDLGYRADENSARLMRSKSLLTKEFFAAREGYGTPAADPIFIVGLPRSGSTLLEQILSSHSQVEGTMELPDLTTLARRLGAQAQAENGTGYVDVLATLSADECRALGEEYLRRTRIQRKTAAPFFIDKLPNNFAHIGLIQLILPNAKIIDARRHPLGCCFSGFKQHFAMGQAFTYSLDDIGRYYRDYVELMAHYDAVLPGRVHRVIYENMVENTEAEVRRLLDHCQLPFEDTCLQFYRNERAVRTASSQQVRQPIFRDAVDHWRHYEPWIEPLKSALGPVLEAYPAVPEFSRRDTDHSKLNHQQTGERSNDP